MNGLAIIEKTDTAMRGVYIDQETIECARQNARVRQRIEQAEENARIAYEKHLKAERAEAKRKAYVRASIQYIATHGAICGAAGLAWAAGMIHPVICIPVMFYCVCASCVRLGALVGTKWYSK
jgi:hypothetical protein